MASLPYSVVASYLPLPCLGGDLRPVIAVQLEEWSSGMFPCGCLAGGCVSRWAPQQSDALAECLADLVFDLELPVQNSC